MDRFHSCGQRGQSIVEFAIVLPLFLFFVLAIAQFGMMFADYGTLQNMARSTAREASLAGPKETQTVRTNLMTRIQTSPPDLHIYKCNWSDKNGFNVWMPNKKEYEKGTKDVAVYVHASLNPDGEFFNYVLTKLSSDRSAFDIEFTYKMYLENKPDS